MDLNAILTIVSAGLGFIALVASGFLIKTKGKLSQVIVLGKDVVDVVEAFEKAVADNTVTSEEVAAIKVELVEVKAAFKALVSKVK